MVSPEKPIGGRMVVNQDFVSRTAPAVAWGLVGLYLVLAALAVWLRVRSYAVHAPGVDLLGPIGVLAGGLLLFGLVSALGALVVARRPGQAIGRLMIAVSLVVAVEWLGKGYAAIALAGSPADPPRLGLLAALIAPWQAYVIGVLGLVVLPLVYPDGRLSSWWGRIVAGAAVLFVAVMAVGEAFAVRLVGTLESATVYAVSNPVGSRWVDDRLTGLVEDPLAIFIAVALVTVIVRFFRSEGVRRVQMRWLAASVTSVVAAAVVTAVSANLLGSPALLAQVLLGLAVVSYPVALALGALRADPETVHLT
jgi:hypothetical protein